jgi:hypothetical protein
VRLFVVAVANQDPGPLRAAHTFGVLLQGDLLETAMLGGPVPGPHELRTNAHDAAAGLLALIEVRLL